ncbi:hypothetical protein L6164_021182 [Bauhinia variegata]|uniref:Uncharacterized protein n=1 Tax=Bauhinia variegata TaxID=167791 RepID=A0ACB9MXQ5_BAUVA|nr:hypothetical protein L6164_021182 [Bauhinia variegata]
MMPAYGSMDSHPYQRNQMPFPHYYHPAFDVPPQANVDPSRSTLAYEQPWPYAGSYGCPTPVHFCCGYNNYPSYCSYRPAYPHIPTPPPMYYPAHAESYSIPCAPPQHYIMDLPRYEYDKCMPREYHCCGCPNHPLHQKEDKGVKIEEHEPDTEKKANDGLVPTQLVNYPYPFVWTTPEYMNNKEQKKPVVAEMDDQDKVSHDAKHSQYFRDEGQEPRSWNGWLPFDAKTLPKMILDGDGRRNQHQQDDKNRRQMEDKRTNQNQQSEDKRMEFPFPIFWVPYYNKQEESGRTNDQASTPTPTTIEEVPRTPKFVPVNIGDSDADRTSSNRDEPVNIRGSDVTEKVSNKKNIPVKQMEMHQTEDDSKGSKRRERTIPVKQLEENMTDKSSKIGAKGSKLPPVCLRVDPLPKKKNGNGNSRSPSPPASKEHSQATAGETAKVIASPSMSGAQPDSKLHHASNANNKVKHKEENVEVSMKTNENKDDYQRDKSRSQTTCNVPSGAHENSSGITTRKESWSNGNACIAEEKKEEGKEEPLINEEENEAREARDSTRDDDKGQKIKVLSDIEAAVLIQAAYRGFQVRKWELLKKLKQIAEVSKQVADVRAQIQALEASSGLQNDDKQRVAIGETIMRLLLKLDTVQGLHPSFREMRKTLAIELISMQEKLDSVTAEKSQQQIQELSEMRPVEDIHPSTVSINSVQKHEGDNVAAPGKDSSEGSNTESHDIQEPCQDQDSLKTGISGLKTETRGFVAHNLPDDDKRESRSEISPVSNREINPNSALNDVINEDAGQAVTNDVCNFESPLYDTDQVGMENETISECECVPTEVEDLDVLAWKELPQGVNEEEPVHFDSGKLVQSDMERPEQSEVSTKITDNNSLVMADDLAPDEKFPEIEAMAELPVGILDDSTEDGEYPAIEVMAELPVGILDDSAEDGKYSAIEALAELLVGY